MVPIISFLKLAAVLLSIKLTFRSWTSILKTVLWSAAAFATMRQNRDILLIILRATGLVSHEAMPTLPPSPTQTRDSQSASSQPHDMSVTKKEKELGDTWVFLEEKKLVLQDAVDFVRDDSCGAICTFMGTTRDSFEDKTADSLEYEAYDTMAKKELFAICKEVRYKWDQVKRIAIGHLVGSCPVGETSVVIAVSSVHREDGLLAVKYIIDTLKKKVPIWKKESIEGGLVNKNIKEETMNENVDNSKEEEEDEVDASAAKNEVAEGDVGNEHADTGKEEEEANNNDQKDTEKKKENEDTDTAKEEAAAEDAGNAREGEGSGIGKEETNTETEESVGKEEEETSKETKKNTGEKLEKNGEPEKEEASKDVEENSGNVEDHAGSTKD